MMSILINNTTNGIQNRKKYCNDLAFIFIIFHFYPCEKVDKKSNGKKSRPMYPTW